VLWPKYVSEQKGANWTKSRTTSDYNQKFETFLNWIGDRPIYMVTREDYANFKTWLLTEYASPKAKPGEKGLDARSVDKYTTAINGLFKWAQNSGFFPDNMTRPTALQTIMSKTAVRKRAKQRIANRNFHDDELKIAFDPQVYAQENQVPHHFWGPLLALFTGARRAEVAQLLLRDVRQEATDTEPIWVIDISDDDVQKSVKSDAARRTVPVHPVLIEIGLLDYINEVKAEKRGPQLFPHIEANKHGERGNAVGQAWRRYLITRGLRSETQTDEDPDTLTFHSMRHTSIALLKKKKVSYDMRCQMVGHEAGGQQDIYGGDTPVETLAEVVFPVFKYPGLDFATLKYRAGSALVRKKARVPTDKPAAKPEMVVKTKQKK
jgi:integrase